MDKERKEEILYNYKNRDRRSRSSIYQGRTSIYIFRELIEYEKDEYRRVYENSSENFKKTMPSELTREDARKNIIENINLYWSHFSSSKQWTTYKNSITNEIRKLR